MQKPTAEQCDECARLPDFEGDPAYAIWYPQMGGYSSMAVITFERVVKDGKVHPSCFEAYVWHDGDFPFHEDQEPAHLHHCMAAQFVEFGLDVLKMQGREVPEKLRQDIDDYFEDL